MIGFNCHCGNRLFFPNSKCVQCNSLLGLIPDEMQLCAFTDTHLPNWLCMHNGQYYKPCKNYIQHNVCNWMVALDDNNEYCKSCRLTESTPSLDEAENMRLWFLMEQAKRRLLYSVIKLNLPVHSKTENPQSGLGFAFLSNKTEDKFGNELTIKEFVTTGHSNGLITINLDEADPARRIEMREKMNENYRTLVGHFRHESGHYYWDRLIKYSNKLEEFRKLFGDERLDYQIALSNYYKNGPPNDWQDLWISAYATMHPWEDWAETWAHYLHMVDTLETAYTNQMSIGDRKIANPYLHGRVQNDIQVEKNFTRLFNDWCAVTQILNGLNRSMGLDDAYPFVISISTLNKLRFVHQVVNGFNDELIYKNSFNQYMA